ncbi:hypothetical protein V8C37DRAFT_114897 [Trichoderma ceciliae]
MHPRHRRANSSIHPPARIQQTTRNPALSCNFGRATAIRAVCRRESLVCPTRTPPSPTSSLPRRLSSGPESSKSSRYLAFRYAKSTQRARPKLRSCARSTHALLGALLGQICFVLLPSPNRLEVLCDCGPPFFFKPSPTPPPPAFALQQGTFSPNRLASPYIHTPSGRHSSSGQPGQTQTCRDLDPARSVTIDASPRTAHAPLRRIGQALPLRRGQGDTSSRHLPSCANPKILQRR